MESKAIRRWNLYSQSSAGKIDYRSITLLAPNTVVYGFRIKVSTITRCSLVSPVIHEMHILQYKLNSIGAFRKKKDGSYFKKPCHPFDYCLFKTKEDAEEAQRKVSKDLLEQINDEMKILSSIKSTVEQILD